MIIRPLVEGKGDVQAIADLIRRIAHERHGRYDVKVLKGHKATRSRLSPSTVAEEIEYAHRVVPGGADFVIVVYDSDDDCAAQHAEQFPRRPDARLAIAVREFEAWLLADTDEKSEIDKSGSVRGAKEAMRGRLGRKYRETTDGRKLVHGLDLDRVERNSRSFQHLVKVVGELIGIGRRPDDF